MQWNELGVGVVYAHSLDDHRYTPDLERPREDLLDRARGVHERHEVVVPESEHVAVAMGLRYDDGEPSRVRERREEREVSAIFPNGPSGLVDSSDDVAEDASLHGAPGADSVKWEHRGSAAFFSKESDIDSM